MTDGTLWESHLLFCVGVLVPELTVDVTHFMLSHSFVSLCQITKDKNTTDPFFVAEFTSC